jgi:glyoxylase-like metal-dependent hydrolase (beta-lactamase superfamily II)
MRRGLLLAAITFVGTLVTLVAAAQQTLPTAPIVVEKVRDNLFLLRGGGIMLQAPRMDSPGGLSKMPASGNTLALITRTGVVLVDTKVPKSGESIMAALRTVTDLPVTMIINTHYHDDHTGGNPDFPSSVDVLVHENTARLMQTMPPVTGGRPAPNIFAASKGQGLPKRTFTDRLTLGEGNDRIDLYYFGRAHTGGDAWVAFPAQKVLHAGDVFASKSIPLVDTNNGGSGAAYSGTIARAVATLSMLEIVITGHSPVDSPPTHTLSDLKTYGEFVGEYMQAARDAKRAGRTLEDFNRTWKIPERFLREGYLPIPSSAGNFWDELE